MYNTHIDLHGKLRGSYGWGGREVAVGRPCHGRGSGMGAVERGRWQGGGGRERVARSRRRRQDGGKDVVTGR